MHSFSSSTPARPAVEPAHLSPLTVRSPGGVFVFDLLYLARSRWGLLAVVAAYLIAAALFAVRTPSWQAPDEPAHYNYIAHIAGTGTLPVLQVGDYDQEHLDLLLHTRFAPKLSTALLRYESYQPPLFYLAATPVFWLTGGSLLALRVFNVLLGLVGVLLLYLCVATVFPRKPLLSVGAAAFAGLLPMHVAVAAAVNNDVLAEVLILSALLVLFRWMRDLFDAREDGASAGSYRRLLLLGLLIGLGMATKIYAYLVLPLVVATVMLLIALQPTLAGFSRRVTPARAVRGSLAATITALPALLVGLPLWVRNARLYGRWDLLGLTWHDQVVVGQPRTAVWIAENGWPEYMERAFRFTFQSFWGVFGWMGLFMDARIYTALLVFTGVLFLGLLWAIVRMISGPPDTDMDRYQMSVLLFLFIMVLAVGASYIWYNTKFVQHQGRYFFWGLLPISVIVALGWREVLHPLQGLITGLLAAVLAVSVAISGLLNNALDKWTVLTIGLIALLLLVQPLLLTPTSYVLRARLPARLRPMVKSHGVARWARGLRTLAWATPFILLFVLDVSLALALIPQQLGG